MTIKEVISNSIDIVVGFFKKLRLLDVSKYVEKKGQFYLPFMGLGGGYIITA